MVTQQAAEDAAIEAAVEQLQKGGVERVVQYSEDVKAVIGEGDAKSITLTSTGGKVPVYHRETGLRSDILSDQLKAVLKKRFAAPHPMAGQLVFSLQPTVTPARGEVICLLNPDHPQRAYFDSIGLRGKFCYSRHIASDFDPLAYIIKKAHAQGI